MSKYEVKTYVVQKADREGKLFGPVLAVKLTYGAAHKVARAHAPAKVSFVMADKDDAANGPEHVSDQPRAINCKGIADR